MKSSYEARVIKYDWVSNTDYQTASIGNNGVNKIVFIEIPTSAELHLDNGDIVLLTNINQVDFRYIPGDENEN